MKDLTNHIYAYALKNALEFGETAPNIVLPKLFQHGLEKQDIPKAIPKIQEIVKQINKLSPQEQTVLLAKYLKYLPQEKTPPTERQIPELPKVSKKPILRAAPFPSGALHIGNAKTFLENAMYAEKYKGTLKLVMDDTIGSERKPLNKDAYELIKQDFKFLKIKYRKPIIYKSDRLKIYYKYAIELIKKEKAYVCYCPQEELHNNRKKGLECSCRHFPVKIQLERWEQIFTAKPGSAILRIKTDMQDPNPAFRDRVLFKIVDRPHPRTKKKYRVWPTLEMNWAIDDHLLNITHIIRGQDLQIETQMEKFIWDIFKWKHPITIHTGLVNLEGVGAKISKSKAQDEIKFGKFIGWNDPRTWSIKSLKARGFRPEAIREFIKEIGFNNHNTTAPIDALYSINRKLIDPTSLRFSFVKDPIKIKIKNPPEISEVEVPIHPDKEQTRSVSVSNKIFISSDDLNKFQGKEIRLLHLYNIKLKKDATAKFTSIENKDIPKINWVSSPYARCKILLPNGNYDTGIAEPSIKTLKKDEVLQFERYAFVKRYKKSKNTYEFWFTHK